MSEVDNQTGLATDPRVTAFVSADDVKQLSDHLDRLGRPRLIKVGGLADAIAHCRQQATPAMLIVDISQEAHPLAALDELLQATGPGCRVIVVGEKNDVNLYRSLLGEGVIDYLLKPVAYDQLAQVLQRADEDLPVLQPMAGRTIAVTGASGGSGTSTVVAALALAFSRNGSAPQALVDFDRRNGDLPLLLGSGPIDGLRAALEAGDGDARLLLRTLSRINDRIYLLAQQPDSTDLSLADGQVLQLGAALCRLFGLSLWDLPAQRDGACLDVLRHAEVRIVLTDLTVQDARKVLRLLNDIGDESAGQRLLLVANASRQGGQPVVPRAQFEDFVRRKIDLTIPWAGLALTGSLIRGPLDLDASPVFRDAILSLANLVTGRQPSADARHRGGIANRLRSLFTRNAVTSRRAA